MLYNIFLFWFLTPCHTCIRVTLMQANLAKMASRDGFSFSFSYHYMHLDLLEVFMSPICLILKYNTNVQRCPPRISYVSRIFGLHIPVRCA